MNKNLLHAVAESSCASGMNVSKSDFSGQFSEFIRSLLHGNQLVFGMRPQWFLLGDQKWESLCRGIQALCIQKLLSQSDLFLVLVYGGTGVGKSALVNLLFEKDIVKSSALRPCTREPVFLVHKKHEKAFSEFLQNSGIFSCSQVVIHENAQMQKFILVDAPDYDSVEEKNRSWADFLLRFSHAILMVFSPAKYADELSFSGFLRILKLKKPSLLILNKMDHLQKEQQSQIADSFRELYLNSPKTNHSPFLEPLFLAATEKDPAAKEGLLTKLDLCIQNVDKQNLLIAQTQEFEKEITDIFILQNEEFGFRLRKQLLFQEKIRDLLLSFQEKNLLIHSRIEKDLRHRLSRIAEKKVFYFSKWLVRSVSSLFSFRSEEDSEEGVEYSRGFRDNLLLFHSRMALESEKFMNIHPWVKPSSVRTQEEIGQEFDFRFESFRSEVYQSIEKTFSTHVTTKHSVLAVSQEVLLSLVFFMILGPFGAIPGWEQVLSGLCYLVYGKIPSKNLPSILLELQSLSGSCQKQFDDFLNDLLCRDFSSLCSEEIQVNEIKKQWLSFYEELQSKL